VGFLVALLEEISMSVNRGTLCGMFGFALWYSIVPSAFAQVVQLPVIHQFSVGTTVVVPDRGTVVLGGVDRYRADSVRLGPLLPLLGQRAWGYEVSRSQAAVTATIIDHEEWDRAVLAEAERQQLWRDAGPGGITAVDTAQARGVPTYHAMPARDSRPLTPAELQALRRHKEQAVEQQVRTQLEQAQRMAAAGKPAAARRILETARRQAPGALQQEIDRRLADLANR